jgi:hypothetical protein
MDSHLAILQWQREVNHVVASVEGTRQVVAVEGWIRLQCRLDRCSNEGMSMR